MADNNKCGCTGGSGEKKPFSWLVLFFGLAYFCQHFAQDGLLAQPLQYYLKEVLHYTEVSTAAFFASLVLPWTIKPVYGLISDYFPLLGYRRKSYLLILNLVATGCFLALMGIGDATSIRLILLGTAFCTAFSDVAVDGLMVELGNKTGQTARFQSMQWIWFNVAAITASLLGGYLIEWFGVTPAFHISCGITAAFPLLVVVATWLMVKEERVRGDLKAQSLETTRGLLAALKSKTLWIVGGFIVFWQFSPSLGTPFYYYQTDVLKFSQKFIGQLGGITFAASAVGAVIFYRYLSDRFTIKTLLAWNVVIGVVGTLAYLLLLDPSNGANVALAIGISIVFGAAAQVSMLTILNLAAGACPKRVEALTFAVLMSAYNLSMQGSSIVGAWLCERAAKGPVVGGWAVTEWLYQHTLAGFFSWFANPLVPLILVSAIFTAVCLPMVRFLPAVDKSDEGK